MAERFTPLFRFGVFNPTHFIIAVLDDEASAEQAAAALGDAGFPPTTWRSPPATASSPPRSRTEIRGASSPGSPAPSRRRNRRR